MVKQTTRNILEVGFAGWPSIGVPQRRALLPDQHLICLGLFDGPNAMHNAIGAKAMMDIQNGLLPGKRSVVRASVLHLPFGEQTMDEVIAANLFGDVRFGEAATNRAAQEIARVLKPGGELTVVETISPTVVPREVLRETMRPHGFQQTNIGSEQLPELISAYSDVRSELGYVAAFSLQK